MLSKLLLQRLDAGLSPQMPGFDPRSVHVGLVVDKMALRKIIFRLLRFSLFSIILPAGPSGRAVYGVGLRPLAYCDREIGRAHV